MDIPALLERIQYTGPVEPTAVNLVKLHRAFTLVVPFENFDIHLGRRIVLNEHAFFEKIVMHRRGGFCYELNGLFGALLRRLGYDVSFFSARVFGADGKPCRDFGHMLLLANCQHRWIADVGFGDLFTRPLNFDAKTEQFDEGVAYRIIGEQDRYVVQRQVADKQWQSRYSFTLTPRQLPDFQSMCYDLQTSSDSWFRTHRICTRATEPGRITLMDDRITVDDQNGRTVFPVQDEPSRRAALGKYFGIVLDNARGLQ